MVSSICGMLLMFLRSNLIYHSFSKEIKLHNFNRNNRKSNRKSIEWKYFPHFFPFTFPQLFEILTSTINSFTLNCKYSLKNWFLETNQRSPILFCLKQLPCWFRWLLFATAQNNLVSMATIWYQLKSLVQQNIRIC